MDVHLRLKEIRALKNMTGKDFAFAVNVDNSQYSKIESGKLAPTVQQLMEISSKFNVSIDWLLTGKGDMTKTTPHTASLTITGETTRHVIEILESENTHLKHELMTKEKLIDSLNETIKSKDELLTLYKTFSNTASTSESANLVKTQVHKNNI